MSIYLGGNNKLKGAYIGKINYRDRQGPCPDGFHVPLFDEATNLLSYMGGFGLMNKEGFKQYLLMPPAGRRMPTDANISGQGSELYYRTCEVSTTSGRSRCLMAYDNYFIISQYFQSGGASIRPFKNEPVYPDNTWNILYGTIDNGISHNATLGLISIVRGDNIITIADKNVGATTVYNNGDTLSEANCGGYFQRGNNYMFPFTGNVTTDNTLINASSYGPGNYYYGETYILGTPTWMTSVNSNIWGGTSPNRTPIKRIVIFPDGATEKQIRPELMGPGIYHNPTLGLISLSSDGTNWITIADKNLGASVVWNGGDAYHDNNCGNTYQRGNCYGFPGIDTIQLNNWIMNKVDTTGYGPGNYYYSDQFVTETPDPRCFPFNGDLRGDETDTLVARRGPCPEGFHIPSYDTLVNIGNVLSSLGLSQNGNIYLKIPSCGLRKPHNYGDYNDDGCAYIGCSSVPNDNTSQYCWDGSSTITEDYNSSGPYIRPFKNTPVHPDETWTKLYEKVTPLCFTAEDANSTVALNKYGNPTAVNIEISSDGTTWTDYTIGNTITLANVGDKVYVRNKSETDTGFSTNTTNYYSFSMAGKIGASGDVTTLLNKNSTNTLSSFCFASLFYSCTTLTTAPSLPATTLANYCYYQMFFNCTSLTTVPELPAATLYDNCYDGMFGRCSSLTTTPELPATTLANGCYRLMFYRCTSITTAPELPATTLANGCCYQMFLGCESLTTLPNLLATTLAVDCYRLMFADCAKIKLSTTQTGEYQIPYRIPTTGTGTTATDALYNMFDNTGGTFKGTPTINTTYYLSNLHSMAEGSAVL